MAEVARRPCSRGRDIRAALRQDACELDRIALESKAHWGYTAEQLAVWAPDLRTAPDTIEQWPTCVAELAGTAVAFAQLDPTATPWELVSLWVLPEYMGKGFGRALLDHVARIASSAGICAIHIDSDPNALGFYLACGAIRVGEVPAPIAGHPGRSRPQLRLHTGVE